MVNASIKYLGGIENGDLSNPEYVTLTGSSTLVKFESELKNISVLIDYGFFQGGMADDEFNERVDKEALDADFIVLTHAHLDHCGRIPLLVKNGFVNPIYMTNLTALQSREILLDSVKVAKSKIEIISQKNEKREVIMKYHLYIIDAYTKLKSSKLSKEDRVKINGILEKKLGNNTTLEEAYKIAVKFCEENDLQSYKDILGKLDKVPELLYDEDDVINMFSLVHLIDIGEEEVLNDFFYIDKYNKKTLDYILDKVLKGYNEDIFIDNSVFNKIKEEIAERIKKTKKILEENARIKVSNEELSEKLDEALNFVLYVDREQSRELYDEYLKFLKKHGVEDYSDIDDALEKPYKIKYSIELLQQVSKLLKVRVKTSDEKNKRIIDSIKLNFLSAGHLEGSVQALITVVTESVNTALRKKKSDGFSKKTKKYTNLLFSGDLGRINNPNLSGKPDVSDLKLDYAQYETTYAGRNHPDRLETERNFFEALINAERKVLIPTFSMQRTQEIIMLLLEDMYKKRGDKDELEKLKSELDGVNREYDEIENKDSPKAKQLLRTIEILKDDIKTIKKSSFFFNIVLDSPLSEKITNIYLSNLGEKYDLLDPNVQIELFGREVISYVRNKKEQKDLYKGKRAFRKEIIVSSSGMCEGGAVVSHLEENLENPKSTIVFVGYTPPNSRGGKIKAKEDVLIETDTYKVLCNVVDIKGFSGHIDESELLQLISKSSISRGAKVALTHGTDSRLELREKIRKEVFRTRKSIEILVPDLGDTVEIKI